MDTAAEVESVTFEDGNPDSSVTLQLLSQQARLRVRGSLLVESYARIVGVWNMLPGTDPADIPSISINQTVHVSNGNTLELDGALFVNVSSFSSTPSVSPNTRGIRMEESSILSFLSSRVRVLVGQGGGFVMSDGSSVSSPPILWNTVASRPVGQLVLQQVAFSTQCASENALPISLVGVGVFVEGGSIVIDDFCTVLVSNGTKFSFSPSVAPNSRPQVNMTGGLLRVEGPSTSLTGIVGFSSGVLPVTVELSQSALIQLNDGSSLDLKGSLSISGVQSVFRSFANPMKLVGESLSFYN